MNSFVITSYYTLDTPYQAVAHDYLMSSIKSSNLLSDIRGVSNLGSWQSNTSYKATFVRQMLDLHKDKNIIFLDADAEVLQPPTLFKEIPEGYNIAAHTLDRNAWYNKNFPAGWETEFLSGTLFLRNNAETRRIVDKWVASCDDKIWEQKVLAKVLEIDNVPIFNLPIEYCWITSLPNGNVPFVKPVSPIVIQHNQVSRLYRYKV